jgi:dimethylargininase
MLTAVTRRVSPRLAACELEFLPRIPIDVAKASAQHRNYELTLESLGARVVSLPALDDQPDCVFVEDPALVLDEIAVITRMGAPARRSESESLAKALAEFRPLAHMREPATLDGGDVVRIGRTLYVGRSRRTNQEGVRQLAEITQRFGYRVVPIEVTGCLHLKSACCAISDDAVLCQRAWINNGIDAGALGDMKILNVATEEPGAADVLRIGGTILMPATFPRTRAILENAGYRVETIDVSELMKAEAGVTCMSLLFEKGDRWDETAGSP